MKHISITRFCVALLLVFAPGIVSPQGLVLNAQGFYYAVGSGGPSYLISQGFEGTGYDNSESWTETTNPDEDYATAPAPLVGSQSLYFSNTLQRATSPSFTAQDEIWIYWQAHYLQLPTTTLLTIIGPSVGLDRTAGGGLRIGGTVNSPTSTDTLATGSLYHFLIHYRRDLDGGGGSAFYSVEFNTSGTFNGSGNDYVEATTGTDAAQATQLRFHGEAGTTVEYIMDKVRCDDVAIGSNPP